jgi:hypothetical protein
MRDEAELRRSELESDIMAAAVAKRGDAYVQFLRRQSDAMLPYLNGLTPTNNETQYTIRDGNIKDGYYAQMTANERNEFWRDRWSIDVMVTWLWEFNGVLHFQ